MQREFARETRSLQELLEFAEEFCSAEGVDPRSRYVIELTLEELFINTVKHNPQGSGLIRVELDRRDDAAEIALTDFDADLFDPTRLAEPNTDAPLAERKVGGLGIHLIKQMTDDLRYEYKDRTSRTIVTKRLEA